MRDNNTEKGSGPVTDFSNLDAKAIGIFTRNAVEHFEKGIVNETNYLEKVDAALEKDKRSKDK